MSDMKLKARRWLAARAHSWMNRFRRLLIRCDKMPQNYLASLDLACGMIAVRAAGVMCSGLSPQREQTDAA